MDDLGGLLGEVADHLPAHGKADEVVEGGLVLGGHGAGLRHGVGGGGDGSGGGGWWVVYKKW